jgi:hypothetical protein
MPIRGLQLFVDCGSPCYFISGLKQLSTLIVVLLAGNRPAREQLYKEEYLKVTKKPNTNLSAEDKANAGYINSEGCRVYRWNRVFRARPRLLVHDGRISERGGRAHQRQER